MADLAPLSPLILLGRTVLPFHANKGHSGHEGGMSRVQAQGRRKRAQRNIASPTARYRSTRYRYRYMRDEGAIISLL